MYENQYNNYQSYDRHDIDVFLENYKVCGQDYLDRIRAIQSLQGSKKELNNVEADMDRQMDELEMQKYQRVVDEWKNCQQFIIMGWYYESKDLMALGTFKYGFGLDDYVTVLAKGGYVAITYGKYLQSLTAYMFILTTFVVTFVLFISVVLKYRED